MRHVVQAPSRAIAAGESVPFETAALPHYAGLVRRLTLVLGDLDDAQDVAQETYLRAHRSWTKFEGEDVRAWLYTIGLRLAFNRLRSRRRWLVAVRRVEPKAWPDHVDPDLAGALAGLRPEVRSAILLTVVDGYTHGQAAAIMQVPVGTLSSWVSRGLAGLREILGPDPAG
jgi:RNA polymerase sigma-70 factor (ECF subfamily)